MPSNNDKIKEAFEKWFDLAMSEDERQFATNFYKFEKKLMSMGYLAGYTLRDEEVEQKDKRIAELELQVDVLYKKLSGCDND
jgi:hypothetical protein